MNLGILSVNTYDRIQRIGWKMKNSRYKIVPIKAKQLLSHVNQPDDWFGLKYNINLYRGCQHWCIYCDTRSECYQIEKFGESYSCSVNNYSQLKKIFDELCSKFDIPKIITQYKQGTEEQLELFWSMFLRVFLLLLHSKQSSH